jgi:plasmid stabilization system protein ParE
MEIFLTKRAEKDQQLIKDLLTIKWGIKSASDFEQKILRFLELISNFPEIGIMEVGEKQIRSFLITRQTRVYYRIKENKIVLLTFFDTRKNPKKRPQ